MEEYKEEDQDMQEDTGNWIKDNLRIIISIIIVVAIAGGIYSYSKRSETTTKTPGEEQTLAKDESKATIDVQGKDVKSLENQDKKSGVIKSQVTSTATSKETDTSFIESAGKGDGSTHLARRALANYLEKNPDSTLTAEHKIYIEDYLRKKVGFRGRVSMGTSIEFSKDLIKGAIDASKKLNERQLNNLKQYSVRVPSLS